MRIHDLEIEMIRLESLSQHPENANNGDTDALSESIDINGFYSPLVVQRSTGRILAGNHRYLVALSRAVPALPCVRLDVSDEEARRIMLADNRITRLGHDDEASLANLLTDLYGTDLALHGTGYDLADYEKLMADIEAPLTFDEGDLPTILETTDPITKSGMRVVVNPIYDREGELTELSILKHDFGAFTRSDVNLIRKALGLNPYTKTDFQASERENDQ